MDDCRTIRSDVRVRTNDGSRLRYPRLSGSSPHPVSIGETIFRVDVVHIVQLPVVAVLKGRTVRSFGRLKLHLGVVEAGDLPEVKEDEDGFDKEIEDT